LHRARAPFSCACVDPLTHILLGANLGYVALGRRLGRTAALAGGLAAFAPDADVFIRSAADPLLAIEHHRGFTHSLSFAPIGAALVAALWLWRPAWRTRAWFPLWLGCAVGYVSHALLDAATTYGTQLLWPFSSHRIGWDVIAIIDPVFTLALLLGLIWAVTRQRFAPSLAALVLGGCYIIAGTIQHARAVNAQQALATARGHRIERCEVMPTMANNVVWRALYSTGDRMFSDRIRVGWFSAPAVRKGWSLPLVRADALSAGEAARNRHRSFERFAWFSDHWVARNPSDLTMFADMRYSLSAEAFDPIWGIRFTPPDSPTEVVWINRSRDREINPGDLWREIIGRDPRFRPLP
jgi:inner membrane protein